MSESSGYLKLDKKYKIFNINGISNQKTKRICIESNISNNLKYEELLIDEEFLDIPYHKKNKINELFNDCDKYLPSVYIVILCLFAISILGI